jgi:hypothetical protein
MNKPAILGALLLGVAGSVAASCSSNKDNTAPANASGGTTATGDAGTGGGATGGGPADSASDALPFACGHWDASVKYGAEGGLSQIGYTDPSKSITLGDGGYYEMPGGTYHGYCWTYKDAGGVSAIYPPCGDPYADGGLPPCFTKDTRLCISANWGPGSATNWGGGFGCSLQQGTAAGALPLNVKIEGKTSLTIGVYGCLVPDQIQVQLNVPAGIAPEFPAGTAGDGYFCNRANLSAPDANGIRTATVQLTDLHEDCWMLNDGGTAPGGPALDPTDPNMVVKSIQAQVNSPTSVSSDWDFCVSQLTIQ